MNFKVNANVVQLFQGLVMSLKPFAAGQQVDLSFKSTNKSLIAYYNPEEITPQITKLLCRIIAFTPQSHKIVVSLDKSENTNDCYLLSVTNSGVDLSRLTEVHALTNYKTNIESIKGNGSRFTLEIPLDSMIDEVDDIPKKNGKIQFSPYYKEIGKRLTFHFSNVENMEKAAQLRSPSEGVFLKKANVVIQSNMHDSNFKGDEFAGAMALSRAQLFRKIKALTKMSPGQYVLYFRLQTAKKLLEENTMDLNVSDVCYQVGFMSKSHFTRSFQKQFGFNPSESKLHENETLR